MIPPSLATDNRPIRLNLQGRGIICSDIHIPLHDVKAVKSMIDWAKKHKYTDWIYLNGDILDCYNVSRWPKEDLGRDISGELDDVRKFLDHLLTVFSKVLWRDGNHEDRLRRYLQSQAKELSGMRELRLENLLGLKGRGIRYIPQDKVALIGPHLHVYHGHEIRMSGGVSPARTLFLRVKANALAGHLHRASQNTEVLPDGNTVSTWTTGCLCGLTPDYARVNLQWTLGFAAMELEGKDWSVRNLRILPDSYKVV